jgi:hypothetical protein
MGNGDPHDVNIELKGNGVSNLHEDAPIITFLQACEVFIGLAFKECDQVVHRAPK